MLGVPFSFDAFGVFVFLVIFHLFLGVFYCVFYFVGVAGYLWLFTSFVLFQCIYRDRERQKCTNIKLHLSNVIK